MTEREYPHDHAAERAALGAVLVTPERWGVIASIVNAEDFHRDAHRRLYRAIAAVSDAQLPINLTTVRAQLERAGDLAEVGIGTLVTLVDGVPRSDHADGYARIVAEHARRCRLIDAADAILTAAQTHDGAAQDVLAEAEARLAGLHQIDAYSGLLDATGQLAALTAELGREAGPKVLLSLPTIDNVLGGVKVGEVLGIMARPGIGKTLIACHAVTGMVGWHPVVFFSLEMPAGQIVRRFVRQAFGLRGHSVGSVNRDEYAERFAALTLDATPGLSVAQMAARVRGLQARGVGVRAVVIDHLGLIGGDRALTTYDRVSTQARELKELAKRLEVAVILLIQVNRDTGGDGSRELHLGSARDSGVVEEACDYMLALRRLDRSTTLAPAERDRYRDVVFAKVVKHRHGPVMTDEASYRIDASSLALVEDDSVRIQSDDLARIAQAAGRRR